MVAVGGTYQGNEMAVAYDCSWTSRFNDNQLRCQSLGTHAVGPAPESFAGPGELTLDDVDIAVRFTASVLGGTLTCEPANRPRNGPNLWACQLG